VFAQINKSMDYTAFSHGQIKSKLWLCEELEPHVPENASVGILGAWYNVLGFMLMVRNSKKYQNIVGLDIDPTVKEIADKICNAWTFDLPIIKNITIDVNQYKNYSNYDVIINCSVEHMDCDDWYYNIPKGTLVCLQTVKVEEDIIDKWYITNPCNSLSYFIKKYPLSSYYLRDTKRIQYDAWGYDRYMLIGIK